MKKAFLLCAALSLSGCSVVKMHHVRDDYLAVDANQTRRLILVVSPLPDGSQKVGELFATVARKYIHQKRDYFYVKKSLAQSAPVDVAQACASEEKVEGLLWLDAVVSRKGDGVEEDVTARLLRCRDKEEVWSARAAGSFPSADDKLKEVTANYVADMGQEVQPFVAPVLNVLRPLLDTLPTPAASDEISDERIANPD